MNDLIRKKELESAYERIMSRENIALLGPSGAGKSYLFRALSQRLAGRRIIFHLDFAGLFQFPDLVHRIREGFEKAGNQNAGLEYQMRRLHQEHPSHRIQDQKGLFEYLQTLMNALFQGGQDVLICIEDPEYCEVADLDLDALIKAFQKMSTAANIQLLLISEKVYLSAQAQLELSTPEPEAIWSEVQEKEQQLMLYSKGNISFIKRLKEHFDESEHFDADRFFKSHHAHFLMLKNRFTDLQWRLLRALASEEQVEQPHAFDFLVKHRLGAASSVERALRNLLDSGFIMRNETAYMVKDPLLHRWLQFLYFKKGL